ncbi:MAG: hypothetical protein JST06_10650 [Bacteroidetes bacterium]|nr:hypothetical protein [Bacteroidota bacterium]
MDTQIFLFYKPNGLFNQRTDSFTYINENVVGGYIYNETDTQYLALGGVTGNNQNTWRLDDVRIILPNVRMYNLTEVMVDGEYYVEDEFICSNGSKPCYRNIVSLKVDGVYHDLTKNRNMTLTLYK